MERLTNPKVIKKYMGLNDFFFKKNLGQNFLINSEVTDDIVASLELGEGEAVLEIGPGIGALTQLLVSEAKKTVAIEIDPHAIKMLNNIFLGCENLEIIQKDVLKSDISTIIKEHFEEGQTVSCVSNLPYYITSPVLMKLLEERHPFKYIVVMMQKEVAERLDAKVGTKNYSAFTIAVDYYAEIEYMFTVKNNSFMPAPKVDSAVLRLTPRKTPPINILDEETFFKTVKSGFAMRRKTLQNCISAGFSLGKDVVAQMLEECEIPINARIETLPMKTIGLLSDCIYKYINNK